MIRLVLELLGVWTACALVVAGMFSVFRVAMRRKQRRQKRMFAVGHIRRTVRITRLPPLRQTTSYPVLPGNVVWVGGVGKLYATTVADSGYPVPQQAPEPVCAP